MRGGCCRAEPHLMSWIAGSTASRPVRAAGVSGSAADAVNPARPPVGRVPRGPGRRNGPGCPDAPASLLSLRRLPLCGLAWDPASHTRMPRSKILCTANTATVGAMPIDDRGIGAAVCAAGTREPGRGAPGVPGPLCCSSTSSGSRARDRASIADGQR